MQRVLVCGGRHYGDKPGESLLLEDVLDNIHRENPIRILIHGDCPVGGADSLADSWAETNYVNCLKVPAKPNKNPWPGAGPIRNKEMLCFKPDLVVAFPGGRGTANMVALAREAGINVLEIK